MSALRSPSVRLELARILHKNQVLTQQYKQK